MNRPGTASRWCLALLLTGLALFATGVVRRPGGEQWALVYDLGLYNCISLAAAALCWQAARRVPAERLAWLAVATALLFSATGDVIYTLVISRLPEEPFPSLADVFWLAYYPALYVALVALIRARVPRFHASMWLDGIIGGLGSAAVAPRAPMIPSSHMLVWNRGTRARIRATRAT